jgi:hypothetical protein
MKGGYQTSIVRPLIIQAVDAVWVISSSLRVYRFVVGDPDTVPQEKNSL